MSSSNKRLAKKRERKNARRAARRNAVIDDRRVVRNPSSSTSSAAVRATPWREQIRCDRCRTEHVSPLVSLEGWSVEGDLFVRNCSGCNSQLLTMASSSLSSSSLSAEVEELEDQIERFGELVMATIVSERATGNRASDEVYAQLEELAETCEERGLELADRADIARVARIKAAMDRFLAIVENMHAAGLHGTTHAACQPPT